MQVAPTSYHFKEKFFNMKIEITPFDGRYQYTFAYFLTKNKREFNGSGRSDLNSGFATVELATKYAYIEATKHMAANFQDIKKNYPDSWECMRSYGFAALRYGVEYLDYFKEPMKL